MVWNFVRISFLNSSFTQSLRFVMFVVLAAVFVGCATPTSMNRRIIHDSEGISLSEDEALEIIFSSNPIDSTMAISENSAFGDSTISLTLREVLDYAFENNPTFAEFAANRELARGELLEATAWHNPEFDSDLRYVTGDVDDVEYDLGLSQKIKLPSKRRSRKEAAEALELVAEREETSFKVLLRAEVTKAYRTVTYRKAKLGLEIENLKLAEEIVATVRKQVDAGSGRPIEVTRAKVEVLKTKKQIQIEQRLRHVAKKVLHSLCALSLPQNFKLTDSLSAQFKPANTKQVLAQAKARNPKFRRLLALQKQKELELKQEEVAWHPDFTPGVGFEKEADEDSYTISLGLEIPLWNKNQGGIAKAKAEIQQIDAQILRAKQDLIRDVEVALETYSGACEQIRAFEELRSASADALKTETFLYKQGEVGFITLLDARRIAQETESEYLAALYEAHLSKIVLEQTIGITGDGEY